MSLPFRLEALEEIALAAAAKAKTLAAGEFGVSRKRDTTFVTTVDEALDAFLKSELPRLTPGSGWLSEETADDPARLDRDLVWIVDPIDGTKQLVNETNPREFTISIGLASRGSAVAAAVINPMTGERGVWVEGATPVFAGLEPRNVPGSLDEAEAVVSRTETEEGALAGFDGLVGSLRPLGSVAYKLLRVASGADTLTFSVRSKSEWDICGGVGLVLAAGGVYLRLDGQPVRFNTLDARILCGAVAGPPALARALAPKLAARLRGA